MAGFIFLAALIQSACGWYETGGLKGVVIAPMDVEDPRAWIRERNRVRQVELEHTSLDLDKVPPGIYGYADGIRVVHPETGKVQLRQSSWWYDFELHKTPNGRIFLIGFIGEDTAARFPPAQPPKDWSFTVYADHSDKAARLAALPWGAGQFQAEYRLVASGDRFLAALEITMP